MGADESRSSRNQNAHHLATPPRTICMAYALPRTMAFRLLNNHESGCVISTLS
jgi:hypothetical protein